MELEDIKKLNIFEKLSLITEEIGTVAKGLEVQVNKKASYKAVSERDILDAVKPIEQKYRVYSYPLEREIVDRAILEKETDYGKTNTLFMRLEIIYRFVNIDKPTEYIDITTYGDGLDTGDKAPGKAMTYGDKYALMKAYKISTGDDPDKEASPEKGYSKTITENKAPEGNTSEPTQKKTPGITSNQLNALSKLNDTNKAKIYEKYKVKSLEELTIVQASEIISLLRKDNNG